MYAGYHYGWSYHSQAIGALATGVASGLLFAYMIHIMLAGFLNPKTLTFNMFTKWALAFVMLVGALGLMISLHSTSYDSLDAINRALCLVNVTSQMLSQHAALWIDTSPLGFGGFLMGMFTFICAKTIAHLVARAER